MFSGLTKKTFWLDILLKNWNFDPKHLRNNDGLGTTQY
jgi:hypothetical protein